MNAVIDQTFEELPVECIQASRTNPRRSFDAASQAELTASIAEMGIQVPLLVRPLVDDEHVEVINAYELVTGERRLRAAKTLQLETVPCLVRKMTDLEACEIQIIENLQREDVHPLEEAEAFQEMLAARGSITSVARRFNKEESYVAKCLRLNALTPWSRDALRGQLITMDHALLLARLAETEQNAALKWCLDKDAGAKTPVDKVLEERLARRKEEDESRRTGESHRHLYVWEPQSVVRLKRWIEAESGIPLSRAPWSLTEEDHLLPDVGPCSECPRNTKANAPLFGDLEMGEATCTDGACFEAKTAGWVQIEQRKAGHDENVKPKVLVPLLSWKSSTVKPSVCRNDTLQGGGAAESANPAKLLKHGQWVEAKPGSCANVRRGITADWRDANDRGCMGGEKKLRKPGELLTVCIAVGCKAHPKAWEKAAAAPRQQEARLSAAEEKRLEEERNHVVKVETEVRSKILHAILGKLDAAKAVRLVAEAQRDAAGWRKRLLAAMPELDGATLEAFALLCCQFAGHLQPNGWWLMQADGVQRDRAGIFALAKQCGLDGAKLAAKYFHDAGSIAPWSGRLYPKGVPWPKAAKQAVAKKTVAKNTAAKKAAAKKAAPKKLTAKKAAKKKGAA